MNECGDGNMKERRHRVSSGHVRTRWMETARGNITRVGGWVVGWVVAAGSWGSKVRDEVNGSGWVNGIG